MFEPRRPIEAINIIQPEAPPIVPEPDLRAQLLAAIRGRARAAIEAIAPEYKQLNLMRENPNAAEFAAIDAVRAKSNLLEAEVLALEDLEGFDLEFEWGND